MEFSIDKISLKISPEEVMQIASMNNDGIEFVKSIHTKLDFIFKVVNELARKQMEIIKRQAKVAKYRKDKADTAEKQPEQTDNQPETEPQPKPEQ